VHGIVKHAAVGWPVSFPLAKPDPAMATGKLTDGLTGTQTPFDTHWLGFAPATDAVVVLEIPARCERIRNAPPLPLSLCLLFPSFIVLPEDATKIDGLP
jgi:hypothetical protein